MSKVFVHLIESVFKKTAGICVKLLREDGTKGTTGRIKTYDRIVFDAPLEGPSGAKLVSYEWKYKWEDYFNVNKGEMVPKRFSDWELSSVSHDTGRSIVHQFEVEDKGNKQLVSSESANILLGFSKRGDNKGFPVLSIV